MRERVFSLRERGHGGDPRPSPPAEFLRRHRLSWAIAVAAAVLLGGVGAFGTDHAPPLTLYSYWLGMMLASALVFALLRDGLEPLLPANPPALALALIVGVAAAMTPVALVVAALVLGGSALPGRLVTLFPQALLIAAAFVTLQWVLERKRASAEASPLPAAPASRPALLDRLPEKLRGGALHAIEAEDHYLRIHTDLGSALVLMRLTDALGELDGLAGAQTHRSWWVARNAVIGASRGRGRAQLTLKGGLAVPVSRTYAPSLRRAGWF